MSYQVIRSDSIEPREGLPGTHYYLEDAIELQTLSVQLVEADPGEEFAPYHAHDESDEVFFVLEGTLHVETPTTEYTVEPGEWFAVAPGNPLHPYNPSDAPGSVRALLVNPRADDFSSYDPTTEP